jgi:hypothetical protein
VRELLHQCRHSVPPPLRVTEAAAAVAVEGGCDETCFLRVSRASAALLLAGWWMRSRPVLTGRGGRCGSGWKGEFEWIE